MENDMRCVSGMEFINRQFVSEQQGQLLKEAPVYIMHDLYKFVPSPDL